MTLHPDLRAMLPERERAGPEQGVVIEFATLTSADLTAFAVAVLKKLQAEHPEVGCGCSKCLDDVTALARRWQEGA